MQSRPAVLGGGAPTVEHVLRLVAVAHLALTYHGQHWRLHVVTGSVGAGTAAAAARLAGRLRVPPPVLLDAADPATRHLPADVLVLVDIGGDPIGTRTLAAAVRAPVVSGAGAPEACAVPWITTPGGATLRLASAACAIVARGGGGRRPL